MRQLPLTMAGRWEPFFAKRKPDRNLPRYRFEPRIGGTWYPVKFQPPPGPNERRELNEKYGLDQK
jgi:hypothetical protein